MPTAILTILVAGHASSLERITLDATASDRIELRRLTALVDDLARSDDLFPTSRLPDAQLPSRVHETLKQQHLGIPVRGGGVTRPLADGALITRVEIAAALAQAVRHQRMARNEAQEAEHEFFDDLDDFTRIGVTGGLAARAGSLAWQHDLRGYDAVRLAAALAWCDTADDADDEVVFACFDTDLRRAATAEGLETWPE